MLKEASTNNHNRKEILNSCDMAYAISLIEKRWSLLILCKLVHKPRRFSELYKSVLGITERMLSLRLKELEMNSLVKKKIYAEVPVKTEYELTELGKNLSIIFDDLRKFGIEHKKMVYGTYQ